MYHLCPNGDATDIRWFGASGSMPLVSNIIEIDGRKLLDGGVVDSIAFKAHEDLGFEKNVVILTQPRDFEKEQTIMWRLIKWRYPQYPKLGEAWRRRAGMFCCRVRAAGLAAGCAVGSGAVFSTVSVMVSAAGSADVAR